MNLGKVLLPCDGYESSCSGSGHCGGAGSIQGLVQWVKGSSLATAVVQIQSLAWELLYAAGGAKKKLNIILITIEEKSKNKST